jgi:DeoR family transcriptional regulator, fructose operon transcriptional repressor
VSRQAAGVRPVANSNLDVSVRFFSLRFDTAVLTCCGLDDDRITTHDLGDAEVKRAMVSSAARVILAADSAKFRQAALAVVARTADVDMIITDIDAPAETVRSLQAAGLEVMCV